MTHIKLLPDAGVTNPMLSGGAEDVVINDVSEDRELDTTYQNTTGKALYVNADFVFFNNSGNTLSAQVDGWVSSTTPAENDGFNIARFGMGKPSGGFNFDISLYLIVPVGWYYEFKNESHVDVSVNMNKCFEFVQ